MRETTHARQANAIVARQAAWRDNPLCYVCGRLTPDPERSAFLDTPDAGPRVTHISPCFAIAVARVNPSFSSSVALRRAEATS